MFRASMFASAFVASALAIMATSSAVTPASAFYSQVDSARNQEVFAHYHPTTTVGTRMYPMPVRKPGGGKK